MLEKTRIIRQTPGECNYHIFYQLLYGADDELLKSISINRNANNMFHYLSGDDNVSEETKGEFQLTCRCMLSIGLDATKQLMICRLLSGILHIGNLVFEPDDHDGQVGGVTAESSGSLGVACDMLGLSVEDLVNCLTKQNMYVEGSTITKLQSHAQV